MNWFLLTVLIMGADVKKPIWISNPVEYCAKSELCAVGNGTSAIRARADARAGIMRWFNTNIKASSRFEEEVKDNTVLSKAMTDVWEGANGILEGVIIKESFEDSGGHYALASFDKVAASNALKLKINQLDSKMKVRISEKTKKSLKLLENDFKIREGLNARLEFVIGSPINEVITYEQLIKYRDSLITKGLSYYIESKEAESALVLATLREALTSTGNKVAKEKSNANRHLLVSLKSVEQHINVEGFVKYEFTLNIDSKSDDKVLNSMNYIVSDTGRSMQHVRDSVIPKMITYIQENIYDLF